MSPPWNAIKNAAVGQPMRFVRRENDWLIDFGAIGILVECLWRLRDQSGIALTVDDDGQQYGLSAPIDAEAQANTIAGSGVCTEFHFDALTADLKFQLSNGVQLDVLTNSSGYESWQAYSGSELIAVGCNNGLR